MTSGEATAQSGAAQAVTAQAVTAQAAPGSGRNVPLEFGWRMPMWDPDGQPVGTWLPAVRENLAALQEHYASAWLSDHFVPGTRWMPPEPDTLECWTATAHLSGAFPSYRYGQIVLGNSYRHPPLLAKAAASLQVLTGGKLILGIGAGWMESEYRMYGYEFPSAGVRLRQLDEACQIIRQMWTQSPVSFQGAYYTVDEAHCNPLPSPPPPLMIGGGGEKVTLRLVARHADWWESGSLSPDEYRRKAGILAEHCDAVGRDPASILHVWQCQVVSLADSEDEARAIAEPNPLYQHATPETRLVGTPEQIAERLEERIDIGVRHVILRFMDFPRTEQALRFMAEVAPRLRRAVAVV
ncbi:MAG: LLM class flavin-dependent oxidoreductase [Chloroflexi bacterium]|nr:LLM class flavin-dependent oxidoreductase [Chloroflexota bacterium]